MRQLGPGPVLNVSQHIQNRTGPHVTGLNRFFVGCRPVCNWSRPQPVAEPVATGLDCSLLYILITYTVLRLYYWSIVVSDVQAWLSLKAVAWAQPERAHGSRDCQAEPKPSNRARL